MRFLRHKPILCTYLDEFTNIGIVRVKLYKSAIPWNSISNIYHIVKCCNLCHDKQNPGYQRHLSCINPSIPWNSISNIIISFNCRNLCHDKQNVGIRETPKDLVKPKCAKLKLIILVALHSAVTDHSHTVVDQKIGST